MESESDEVNRQKTHGPSVQVKTCPKPQLRTCFSSSARVLPLTACDIALDRDFKFTMRQCQPRIRLHVRFSLPRQRILSSSSRTSTRPTPQPMPLRLDNCRSPAIVGQSPAGSHPPGKVLAHGGLGPRFSSTLSVSDET